MSAAQEAEVCRKYREGWHTQASLAKACGVSRWTVRRVLVAAGIVR